ncbi:hypothetical protein NDU88_004902 [Pleurodeles waltl]|uniref:Uncharacterized protein n=1 Tax=Pleurodeles waltl TaxID=8319 RepID=A0AAV7NME4_PLEWA|nr:hypothetical protein NDU88_004902 [Pleurodeles waltl]
MTDACRFNWSWDVGFGMLYLTDIGESTGCFQCLYVDDVIIHCEAIGSWGVLLRNQVCICLNIAVIGAISWAPVQAVFVKLFFDIRQDS